jgi:hypothetical protein
MKRHTSISFIWQSVIVAVAVLMVVAPASADNRIVQPGQQYLGKSYNELASEWTNWLIAEPSATNPAYDDNGSLCDRNQEGKVWFLAGTFENVNTPNDLSKRKCRVPAGKAIFLSLGGVYVSFSPDFMGLDTLCSQLPSEIEQIRCDVNNDVPVAPSISFEVKIDGKPVKDLFALRVQSKSEGFTLKIPDASLLTEWGFSPGDRSPAVSDGYFLYLKPLKPGKHTLKVVMTNADGSLTGVNWTLIVR